MVSVLEEIGENNMFQKIAGVFLIIMCVVTTFYMSYLVGHLIVKDYLLNGIIPVIISFVIGALLMVLTLCWVNKLITKIKGAVNHEQTFK